MKSKADIWKSMNRCWPRGKHGDADTVTFVMERSTDHHRSFGIISLCHCPAAALWPVTTQEAAAGSPSCLHTFRHQNGMMQCAILAVCCGCTFSPKWWTSVWPIDDLPVDVALIWHGYISCNMHPTLSGRFLLFPNLSKIVTSSPFIWSEPDHDSTILQKLQLPDMFDNFVIR